MITKGIIGGAIALLTAISIGCGASHVSPVDCGEGGEYVEVDGVRYCVYEQDVVIIGGFECPAELPHHFGGEPAVICSDQLPGATLPEPVCMLAPESCEAPAFDAGTPSAAVGESCLPQSIPSGGFDSLEIYLETSSPQCASNVCVVYQLEGDPSPDCSGADCADPSEVDARVFCSCRCDAADGQPTCPCPSGMRCEADLVTTGGDGVRGGYCVPTGL